MAPARRAAGRKVTESTRKRFVFQNFAQRVAAVNIDVHHRLTSGEPAAWSDGAVQPASLEALDRWDELNCTSHYKAFRREIGPMTLSLPLILHRRRAIFDALRRHLASAPSIALKPMLEVVAALALDLRHEFYPEFPDLLRSLADLLRPDDVEQLEDIFSTLCYIFKYLLRQLLDDLTGAFGVYSRLLAHEREHVREFAAESFAYLLRRLPRRALPAALRTTILPRVGEGCALDGI